MKTPSVLEISMQSLLDGNLQNAISKNSCLERIASPFNLEANVLNHVCKNIFYCKDFNSIHFRWNCAESCLQIL